VTAGGRIVGRFPFVVRRMFAGHALCGMPELSHLLGPATDPGAGSAANRALKRDGILRELLAKLPRTSGFYQKLHGGLTDTLVFQEQGYRTAVQFTFEIEPAPIPAIWAAMRDKTRNAIRCAQARYQVAEFADADRFAAFYNENLLARDSTNHYRGIRLVCEAALLRDRGRIILALDDNGCASAGIFYVWDARAAHYLLTTRNEQAGNGAVSLLIWHAIQDCATRGLIFDFDGVATPGSRVFYTGFGGQVVPRYIVSRYSLGHRIVGRLSNPFRLPTKHLYQ
jgi:Acetyltransferase (GNAT) domain